MEVVLPQSYCSLGRNGWVDADVCHYRRYVVVVLADFATIEIAVVSLMSVAKVAGVRRHRW